MRKPLNNLLRSAACAPAVLAMLTYWRVRSACCAPASRNLPSLTTVLQRFPGVRQACVRLGLTLAACTLLTACAVEPAKLPPQPATVIARPEPSPPIVTPVVPAAASDEPWNDIDTRLVLHDCADARLIRAKEAMYTRSPARFERLLERSLPLIMYVQEQVQAAGVPGEFVMLPMLESSYNPHEPSRRGDAAGMWQLMPRTARQHGIVVNRHYDGRLDPVASTRVAIDMLKTFAERFGDWRLVDMAYNAGQYAVRDALRKHPSLGSAAIPDIPVSNTTRKHLAKLMALSCILREPGEFHVQLPKPSPGDALVEVQVPAGTRLVDAADMAEISGSRLRALNPGYLGRTIPGDSPRSLLLPANAAQSLAAALAVSASESVAQVNTAEPDAGPGNGVPLPNEPTPPADDDAANPTHVHAQRHRVRKGETLWSIAHRYHVSVADLEHWNHLRDDVLHPGEMLRVHD